MSGPPTVLILDDDVEFRAFLGGLVKPRGMRVLEAGRVSEARLLLESETVDLAIVDGLLPDGSGMDFIAEVRRQQPALKIIFMSAFWRDLKTYKTLTEQLYVNRVINKPFLAREFLVQLETLQPFGPPPGHEDLPPPSGAAERIDGEAGGGEEERLEAELAILRARFTSRLQEKIDEINEAYAQARASGNAPATLDRVVGLAHRLHGTAGAYGLSEVSRAAGSIENVLREVRHGRLEAGPVAWREVNRALKQLNQASSRRLEPGSEATPPSARPRGWELRVLIVDRDSPAVAEVAGTARRHLVELVSAASEEEALALAQSPGGLDGAIICLDGAEEGGFALAHALRATERHAGLPIAFISARDSISERVAAAYAGASLFLTSPAQADQLSTTFEYFATLRRAEQPRVLVVDDDPAFLEHVSAILGGQNMKVTCLSEPLRVLEVMADQRPDLLLLDVIMPTLSGYDICKMVRATPEWQSLPILFLTIKLGAIDRLACFEAGGDDYLPKPVLPAELLARIRVRLERRRIHQEQVSRDSLTGLLGRQAFAETVEKRLAENRRLMRPLALCLIDLDNFKMINDRYGHLAGDRVLQGLGRLLRSRFRTEDVRGRWGGEEFTVAFNGEGAATAGDMLARVLEEFRQQHFSGDRGESFTCTFSGGVAIFPDDGYALEELVRAADRRLYRAKESGRNQIAL